MLSSQDRVAHALYSGQLYNSEPSPEMIWNPVALAGLADEVMTAFMLSRTI
jgi:hypothetical protein